MNYSRILYKLLNGVKRIRYTLSFSSKTREKKSILKKNRELKGKYAGKRCFIVANGPSIKEENLAKLKGEYCFTVNQMIRKQEYAELNPLCNFWFDPAYFDENMPIDSKTEFEDMFIRTRDCNDHILSFVPYSAKTFLEKRGLLNDRVHFIESNLMFYDDYDKDILLDRLCVSMQNIVQYGIIAAIYMGFSEIYILGCDSTGIITKIDSVLGQSIEDCYSYQLGQSGQKYVNSLLDYFSIEEQFAGWTRIFHLYKELTHYCESHNIRLVNCSSKTIIEGVPRGRLTDVINGDKI